MSYASQGQPGDGQSGHGPARLGRDESADSAWAMLAYLSIFAVWILGPLVAYLAKRRRSPFVRQHAAQAFNMQITLAIYVLAAEGLLAATYGTILFAVVLLAGVAVILASLVFLVVAVVRAAQCREYDVPTWLCFRIVR
jgi:uncharacterized Tic20 family protein